MRILHFYKTYVVDSCGGVEQVIYQLARGSALLGHTVDVLSLSRRGPKGPTVFDNHTAHRPRLAFEIASTGFSFSVIRAFAALAREADIIHYHFPWPFLDVVHFATQVSRPTVLTYHSDVVRQRTLLKLYRPLMMRLLGSVDRIVATSPNYLATSDVLSKFREKTSVIAIGLDRATYPMASIERLADWRAQLGGQFFLFVGALRYYKGLHVLLEAVQGTELTVVIVGAGPMEQELRQQSARLNLPSVHFLGWLPDEDKVALIRLCLAVVFPSHLRSEAFGISLVEGAMFGKPLISSEIGTGTSFVNVHGETGLVVPPNDADAFRRAMIYLALNPAKARLMGQNAERRYHGLFRAEHMVASYTALYQELWTASGA